jgi:hypothetical protein
VLTAACLVAVALPAAGIAWARAGGGSGPAGDRPVLPAVASTAPALIGDEPPTSTPASTSLPVPTGADARRNSNITPARADAVTTASSSPGVSTATTPVARPTDDLPAAANEAAPGPSANVPGPPTTGTRPPGNLPAPANEDAPRPPAGVPGPPDDVPAPGQDGELGPSENVPNPPADVPGPPEGMPEQAANGRSE